MLPFTTAHIARLRAKAYTGGGGGLNHPPYWSYVIFQNIVLLRKTNKLLLYSHIKTKYLIIVNKFFVI